MAGVLLRVEVDDRSIHAMLQRLIDFGGNQSEAMKDIATAGEASTRERFKASAGPDGQPWKPGRKKGGKTLIQARHLLGSIVNDSGDDYAQWGTNMIYAAIHQFGGVIHAKTDRGLFFKLADGSGRRVKQVTIPARPYLGINATDEMKIIGIINQHLAAAVGD